jgi:hypothetical protein
MTDEQDDARTTREARAASDALDEVRAARARIAARAVTPWWYPPAYGLGMGGLVASLALPMRVVPFATLACTLYLLGVYALWQRVSGLSVRGDRPGKTRHIAIGIACTAGFCVVLALMFRDAYPDGRVAIIGGVVTALVAARGSIAWDRAWRAELRGDVA